MTSKETMPVEGRARAIVVVVVLLAIGAGVGWYLALGATGVPAPDQLRPAASVAGLLLLIAASAGVAAMATVQFWKVLFRPRATFHEKELDVLFGETTSQILGFDAAAPNGVVSVPHSPNEGASTPRKPVGLRELLDNPTEVVMAQLRSGADYIMLRPAGFEHALKHLAGPAGGAACERYLTGRPHQPGTIGGSDDALIAVRFFVEQHLNLIHARLRERWRWRVRMIAVIVAVVLGALLSLILLELGPMAKASTIVGAAIWGGFFSWFARDLVAIVERRRA